MVEQSRNLWPVIEQTITRTPLTILREQAGYLGRQTSNIILGEVKSQQVQDSQDVSHYFYVVAPALGNYRYLIMHIIHNAAVLYPVRIIFDARRGTNHARSIVDAATTSGNKLADAFTKSLFERDYTEAKDEGEFLLHLQTIFADDRTLNIVRSLMANSQQV